MANLGKRLLIIAAAVFAALSLAGIGRADLVIEAPNCDGRR